MFTVITNKHSVIKSTSSYNDALNVYNSNRNAYRLTRYDKVKDAIVIIKERVHLRGVSKD